MKIDQNYYKELINSQLEKIIPPRNEKYDPLIESMNYSLLAGGKRIRPMIALEFCRISGGDIEKALKAVCSLEMIHTYSLIHDDLPCMDNDDLRRGKPTNHKIYGECTATLAGDALQAEAYRTILSSELTDDRKALCCLILSEASGVDGICGGQYLDMEAEGKVLSEEGLKEINRLKTGAMLIAACKMGVAAAGGSEEQMSAAEEYGDKVGQAFQIRDDILDVVSTEEKLGKPIGSDVVESKNTFMAIYGQEKCEQMIYNLTEEAKNSIKGKFLDTEFLFALADSMAVRDN